MNLLLKLIVLPNILLITGPGHVKTLNFSENNGDNEGYDFYDDYNDDDEYDTHIFAVLHLFKLRSLLGPNFFDPKLCKFIYFLLIYCRK